MTEPTEVTVASTTSAVALPTTLEQFEAALLDHADMMGLPSSGVLVPVPQRVQVLTNMDGAMAGLTPEKRAHAMYLSKFMMAVSAGLFDAALNYLWDETITELRKRIVAYDLNYFFDLAVATPEKRKDLKGPDDLVKITDEELIQAAARIGFISPVGRQQLDLVRFMRNHASAAHPNQHELQPYTLLGYMETCIKEVITLPQSSTMVATSRLLSNIKTTTLTAADTATFATLFNGLRPDQAETLANGLFGIYVTLDSTPTTRDNIRLVLDRLWPHLTDDTKFSFGTRHARFKANLDTKQAELAREFLESVGGESYLPEDIRTADIDVLLDRLHQAHNGFDNFYTEPPIMRELADYVGTLPIPDGVRSKYVHGLVEIFLGRSSGISWAAVDISQTLLSQLTPAEAALALRVMTSNSFAALLGYSKPIEQFDKLVAIIAPKIIGRAATTLLQHVQGFTGPRRAMALDTKMSELRATLAAEDK
ncbi:hypothetical protein [Cellulomonas endometrii]|uniref:hypothetical protein n=1 Tax=Cellulomonas endometrii TaxID=3036301 RepID=UPI0024ADA2E0|nr:hypothetical protein [Cellulomonas endometrii]